MKTVVCRIGKKGFTLVELLVVIAIIGILAGMLFPAIAGAMANSKATKVGNDGKQIWLMLYSENTDRVALNLSEVWPDSTLAAFYGNSCDFFEYANNSTNVWLQGLPPAMLSAPGLTPATSWTNISPNSVAWCIVRDLTAGDEADTPFMFTKNMGTGSAALSGNPDLNTVDSFVSAAKPFGDSMGVIVTWGGSIKIMKKKQANTAPKFKAIFNPNSKTGKSILVPA